MVHKYAPGVGVVVLVLTLGACGSSGGSSGSSRPGTAAASPTQSCQDKAIAWRDGSGGDQLKAISRDLGAASRAGSSGDLGALQGAATQLGTDAQTALANLPPGCVPGMRADYATALHDFIAGDQSASTGTLGGIQNAATQIQAGGAAAERATRDLSRWERTVQ